MRLTPFGVAIFIILAVAVAARYAGVKADPAGTSAAPATISLPR